MDKLKKNAKRILPKTNRTLRKKQKEVQTEDVFVALADLIIDSFLGKKAAEKVIYFKRGAAN